MRGLHPAVVRPGRCLADVEFTTFSRDEASQWLDGAAKVPAHDITLAELYRLRGDLEPIGNERPLASTGTYL
jgi:hypothetical protein